MACLIFNLTCRLISAILCASCAIDTAAWSLSKAKLIERYGYGIPLPDVCVEMARLPARKEARCLRHTRSQAVELEQSPFAPP